MSFLHSHSCECTKSELDLFAIPPTQTMIENSHWVQLKPINSLTDNSPIEFSIIGSGEEYLDLAHTLLYVRVSLRHPEEITDAAKAVLKKVGPVNNFMHSLFTQVDVSFNRQPVSPPNNAYAYRAYIETLLNYGSSAKNSHLTSVLWWDDTPGSMDDVDGNVGLSKRRAALNKNSVDMIGHLHCDVFNQDKLLLNGVEVGLRLIRNSDAFALMDPTGVFEIRMDEAALLIRRVRLNPTILLEHNGLLAKQTAKYPITRVQIKSFVIHSGVHGESLDNVILGQLPKRIIIGFVKNKSFNGDRGCNPFNFEHFSINYLNVYVDGVQVPSRQLQPNFETDHYVEAYQNLFIGTGIHFKNQGNCITKSAFSKGYTLFAYDFTPDLSANENGHWNLVRHGGVRVDVKFAKALEETINCIVYAEYDNILEIDSARQCLVDYCA